MAKKFMHITKNGDAIALSKLEDSRLRNIINFMQRKAKEGIIVRHGGGSSVDDIWYDEDMLYGDMRETGSKHSSGDKKYDGALKAWAYEFNEPFPNYYDSAIDAYRKLQDHGWKFSSRYGWRKMIGDDFGNFCSVVCPDCNEFSMYVLRPGDFRCSECE